MLNTHHRLVHKFRIVRESLCSPYVSKLSIQLLSGDGGPHGTRFSGLTTSEVAALIVGDLTPEGRPVSLVIEAYICSQL